MAKTVELVEDFMADVESNLLERGAAEMKSLLEKKTTYVQATHKDHEPCPDCIPPWDHPFFSNLTREEMSIRHELIAEYFPLRSTLMSMLEVFASCRQLNFIPMTSEALTDSTRHDDVEAWSVWDSREQREGEFIDYLSECEPSVCKFVPHHHEIFLQYGLVSNKERRGRTETVITVSH